MDRGWKRIMGRAVPRAALPTCTSCPSVTIIFLCIALRSTRRCTLRCTLRRHSHLEAQIPLPVRAQRHNSSSGEQLSSRHLLATRCTRHQGKKKTATASRSRKSNAPAARKGLCALPNSYGFLCALPRSYGFKTKSHSRMCSYETASAQRTIRENFSRGQHFGACMCPARSVRTCTRNISKMT